MATIEDNLLVCLDPLTQSSQINTQNKEILVKNVNRHFMEKKVGELITYMLNPNRDDLNQGYNESEQKVVNMIKEWIETAKSNPKVYTFVVAAETIRGGDPMELRLENKVSGYEGDILQSKPISEGGQSVTRPYIGLFARLNEISGIATLVYLPKTQSS